MYHNVRDEVAAQGVVYTDMESALKGEYADMVHKYFMKLVTPRDHKFAALHSAEISVSPSPNGTSTGVVACGMTAKARLAVRKL